MPFWEWDIAGNSCFFPERARVIFLGSITDETLYNPFDYFFFGGVEWGGGGGAIVWSVQQQSLKLNDIW